MARGVLGFFSHLGDGSTLHHFYERRTVAQMAPDEHERTVRGGQAPGAETWYRGPSQRSRQGDGPTLRESHSPAWASRATVLRCIFSRSRAGVGGTFFRADPKRHGPPGRRSTVAGVSGAISGCRAAVSRFHLQGRGRRRILT